MKNKKLLKTILCITSGIGFATSIPFMTTACACGSSSTKTNILPDDVYKYDPNDSAILTGFTDEFLANPNAYKQYNTMEIPASVTSISESAFYNQLTLQTDIPLFIKNLIFADGSNCSSIGQAAFALCSSIKDIKIDNNYFHDEQLGTKGKAVITGKRGQISWNDSSVAVGSLACGDIVIPANVSSIVDYAFGGCSSLTSIDLSKCNNLSSIGEAAFGLCNSINDIKINNNYYHVEQLGAKGKVVIQGKMGTTSWNDSSVAVGSLACGDIVIPDNITSIANKAFQTCGKITSLNFPSSLESIGYAALNGCISLTSADFSNCTKLLTISNSAFEACQYLNLVSFPSTLSEIGEAAFSNCVSLNSVTLPNSLIKIGRNAFMFCSSLTSITFPNNLMEIIQGAFYSCTKLGYIAWDLPDGYDNSINIGNDVFANISSTGKVKSLNQSISSDDFLAWIQTKGNFPSSGWEAEV